MCHPRKVVQRMFFPYSWYGAFGRSVGLIVRRKMAVLDRKIEAWNVFSSSCLGQCFNCKTLCNLYNQVESASARVNWSYAWFFNIIRWFRQQLHGRLWFFRHALQHHPIFACGFKLGQLLCATGTMHVGLDQLPHNRMRLPATCWVNMFPTDIERSTYHLMFREVRANWRVWLWAPGGLRTVSKIWQETQDLKWAKCVIGAGPNPGPKAATVWRILGYIPFIRAVFQSRVWGDSDT